MDDDQAINRLMAVYSQLLDDCRWDEWAELFTEDAVFTVWGQVHRGRDDIRRAIGGMQPELPGKHVAFATVIDVNGDEALAWTDFTALADDGAGRMGALVQGGHGRPLLRPPGSHRAILALRSPGHPHGRRPPP